MQRTIRWRLGLPFVLLIMLVMAGLGGFLTTTVRQTYIRNLEESLASEARLVAGDVQPDLLHPTQSDLIPRLTDQYSQILGARLTVIRADGQVLGDSSADPQTMENHLLRPEVRTALSGQVGTAIRLSSTLQMDMLYVAVPIMDGSRVLGVVRLAESLNQIESGLASTLRTIEITALATIVVTILLSLLLTQYAVRPILRLTEIVRRLASGDFQSQPLPTTQDEIGHLNQAFNQMAVELREQIGALQAERGKLAAVLSHMSDGVLIVDSKGDVQLVNPAVERMFSLRSDNLSGRSLVEVVRHHQLVELWRRCQETGVQQVVTIEISAEKFFLQAVATPLKEAIPGSILLLLQDLTRMRRLETVRQDFVSNVSHELRTPLASLKALTETLQEGALDDPPAAHRFLSRMDTEIDTLTQMVHELLELSRIESGKVPIQRRVLAPATLLGPAVERMRVQAERARLTLTLQCPDNLPNVAADPERIEQVLVNLLHNAIKFTPPGGEITVAADEKDGQVRFSVHDTGVGIAPKDLERIFERFYKADRARTGGGTGLGLSIARHVVEAHGGRIWAESTLGQGSAFFFTLPKT